MSTRGRMILHDIGKMSGGVVDVQKLLTSLLRIKYMLSGILVHSSVFAIALGLKWAICVSICSKLLIFAVNEDLPCHISAYSSTTRH
ncbi:hypothetical protein CFP56_010371 [Quercus suber]|uniref:Uncharacterized protein n=1 Tax=Quercus suber TaxID=58331 RepID=A0AAW0L1X9_QUESU